MQRINAPNAPKPNGPYSHAIRHGNLVFTSGQLPTVPESGKIETADIASQTRQVLENLQAVLRAAGTGLEHALKFTVYLAGKQQYFAEMNRVYGEYIRHQPARTTVDVPFIKALPEKALVEMDVIAFMPE